LFVALGKQRFGLATVPISPSCASRRKGFELKKLLHLPIKLLDNGCKMPPEACDVHCKMRVKIVANI